MEALFSSLLGNVDWYEIWLATLDTLLMLGGSLLFTILLGLPLGVLLFLCGPRQLFENAPLYAALSFVVNVLRSLPFIILTLGFLLLVINALMLLLTARLADGFDLGFHVDGFWNALVGAVIVTIVGWGVRTALPARD